MQLVFDFSQWNISPRQGIVGRQYDNLSHSLVVEGELPSGYTWDMLVEAKGKYNIIPLSATATGATASLTADQLAFGNTYYAFQLRGTSGEIIHHTNAVQVYVPDTIVGPGTWPVLPTEFSQAEANIKELNAHPPVPGENGYWMLWDLDTHSYVQSQLVVPVGPAGPANTLTIGTVETLAPGQPATAQITGEAPNQTLSLGIPQGQTGQTGATPVLSMGQVETLESGEPATAELTGTPEAPVLSLGIPQGPPGKDGVQLNDSAVNTTEAWSSKKIVDTLCPPFTETGNPITCNPVEDYPLDVTVTMEPIQEGEGDPSPNNVRPISGRDSVTVNVRGKNLCQFGTVTFTGVYQKENAMLMGVYPPGSYRFSADVISPETSNGLAQAVLWNYTENTNASDSLQLTANSGRVSGTFTATKPFDALLLYSSYSFVESQGKTATFSDIQLELSPTPTPYEPYQPGTTAQLSLPETIYGGTVDCVTGVGSEEWKLVTLTGNEQSHIFNNYFYLDGLNLGDGITEGICSHYPYSLYVGNSIGINTAGTSIIYTPIGDYTLDQSGLDSWKSYLAAQASAGTPVQMAYKLATPTSFQATGNQALPAVAGLNTLYTDGDSLTVSGRQDLLYTLQTMQAQTQNLNRFIAEGGAQQ